MLIKMLCANRNNFSLFPSNFSNFLSLFLLWILLYLLEYYLNYTCWNIKDLQNWSNGEGRRWHCPLPSRGDPAAAPPHPLLIHRLPVLSALQHVELPGHAFCESVQPAPLSQPFTHHSATLDINAQAHQGSLEVWRDEGVGRRSQEAETRKQNITKFKNASF